MTTDKTPPQIQKKLIAISFEHPILAYDGLCVLCNKSVQFLMTTDKKRILRYITLQISHPNEESYETVRLYIKGQEFTKSAVWVQLIDILSGAWLLASPIKLIPISLLDYLYDLIARHRYRWFGKRDICAIPSADQIELFILLDSEDLE